MTTKLPQYLKKHQYSKSGDLSALCPEPNTRTSEQHEKTTLSKSDEKSICEKYLNIYETINLKQPFNIKKTHKKLQSKPRLSKSRPKDIFENPIIQKSYTNLGVPQNPTNHENNNRNAEAQPEKPPSIASFNRKKEPPSKKNDMALKLISENQKLPQEKQNLPSEPYEMRISALNPKPQKEKPIKASTQASFYNPNILKQRVERKTHESPSSFWQNNIFVGSSPIKAYGGYYKAKTKKMLQKKKEKLNRNSTTYIKNVDREIQVEKERRQLIRPQSKYGKKPVLGRYLDTSLKVQYVNQSYEFGKEQKIIRTQSEAKLQNFKPNKSPPKDKKTNYFGLVRRSMLNTQDGVGFVFNGKLNFEFERKNNKLYNFNNKTLASGKNFSTHNIYSSSGTPKNHFQEPKTSKTCAFESTNVATYNDSPNDEYLNSIEQKVYAQSKPVNPKMLSASSRHLQTPGSWQKSPLGRTLNKKRANVTLNKIQDAIENDTQLRIQEVNSYFLKKCNIGETQKKS